MRVILPGVKTFARKGTPDDHRTREGRDGAVTAPRYAGSVLQSRSVSTDRPAWLPEDLYPFQSRYVEVGEARLHYIDEGSGPTLLLLHGNPTWSFLYREIIKELRGQFRCVAVDYPGFGLSAAPPRYGFTPAEHADVVEGFVQQLDLTAVTLMVQDWGGPIGFAVATRQPDRFARFVIGNTWAWPATDLGTQAFSRLLGSPLGRYLIERRNFFVETILPRGVRRTHLPEAVMNAYRGPFPTPESRRPVYVFPREIVRSKVFLADVASKLPRLSDRPALLCWPTADFAFREPERVRWEQLFPDHRTLRLQGAGHYIQEDAWQEIVTAIRQFVAP
jgi:haloalkane dehalogenase